MIWRVRKPGARYRLNRLWHNWFAWYPVRVPTYGKMSGMHKVWLKTIRRRGTSFRCGQYHELTCWNWKYKLKDE